MSSVEKLKEKYFYGIPLSLDDCLSYEDLKHGITEKINSMIDTSQNSYDDIIAEMEADLAALKNEQNKTLDDLKTAKTSDFSALNENMTNLTSSRKTADSELLKALEEAIASAKNTPVSGWLIIADSKNEKGSETLWNPIKAALPNAQIFNTIFTLNAGTSGLKQVLQDTLMAQIPNASRITEIIALTDTGTADGLAEAKAYIDENFPNAKMAVGYFGKPDFPNDFGEIIEPACISNAVEYLTDSENILASPALWNSDFTELTGGATVAPYLSELIRYKRTAYTYTRTATISLPLQITDALTVNGNNLAYNEQITEKGYSFTISGKTQITAENSLLEGVWMSPRADFLGSLGSIDNSLADENIRLPVVCASTNAAITFGPEIYFGYLHPYQGNLYFERTGSETLTNDITFFAVNQKEEV